MDRSFIYKCMIISGICAVIFCIFVLMFIDSGISKEKYYTEDFINACKTYDLALRSDGYEDEVRYCVESGIKGVDFSPYESDELDSGRIVLNAMRTKESAYEEAQDIYEDFVIENKNKNCTEVKETSDGKAFSVSYVQDNKYHYLAYEGHCVFTASCNMDNKNAVDTINGIVEELGYEFAD